jgi:multicomponent K+:H+ antiporter subunit G
MMDATSLPTWIAVLVSLLIIMGAALSLTGAVGLLRLPSFYQRIHAPTLGTTLGTGTILVASMLFFTTVESRLVVGEILIGVFVTITTPISFILLAKATRQRAGSSTETSGLSPRIEQKGTTPTRSAGDQ